MRVADFSDAVRLIDRIHAETADAHAAADGDAFELLGPVSAADYRRFLVRSYGFVCPVERSIVTTPDIERFIDVRRFHKHELLERDLVSLRMPRSQLYALPQCTVPLFNTPEEALGWAYVLERSTLGHSNLFRHLASALPGEIAFASAYLKCYFGAVGEMWTSFGAALDTVAGDKAQTVIDGARSAFRSLRTWSQHQDHRERSPDRQQSA